MIAFKDDYDWETTKDLAAFDAVNSLCSPVFIHRREEQQKVFEPWFGGIYPETSTGVLGMVTLNLPRAAYESGNENEFYSRVGDLTGLAVEGLEAKRSRLEEELKEGKMPATSLDGRLIGWFLLRRRGRRSKRGASKPRQQGHRLDAGKGNRI